MIVISIVGARPQFVKVAPVDAALRDLGVDHRILHTGQHHDAEMSDAFFAGMQIPDPAVNLGIGSASHGAQTGRMLEAIEASLLELQPDVVVNYGDTNSTVAGGLAAAKMLIPSVHVEAGLRSFDRSMPEEINRVVVDHISTTCLAPTPTAMTHLHAEGLAERSALVGDVMLDVLHSTATSIEASADVGLSKIFGQEYIVATLHRPENTDDAARLDSVLEALSGFPLPVALPAHPRLTRRAVEFEIALERGAIRVLPPLGYRDLISALMGAVAVVTDSGGVQKEAFELGIPCTTVRSTTEWVETFEDGMNVLQYDVGRLAVVALRRVDAPLARRTYRFGAADRVAQEIVRLTSEPSKSCADIR